MRVIIRADGGMKIGMGHVMRTSVLADSLREFAEVAYVCRKDSGFDTGRHFLHSKGYEVIQIDSSRIVGELKGIHGDCLITDSYEVDERYFKETKELFPLTGCIDDLCLHNFCVDFLLNQNVYAQDLHYKAGKNTEFFLGPRYALLREEFRGLPKRGIRKQIQDILVTMGGADADNMTGSIVGKLAKFLPGVRIHGVVGPSFVHQRELERIKAHNLILYNNPVMSGLMLKCDMAVSACGSTLYELAACGTPTVGIVTADNQRMAACKMTSLGIIHLVEEVDDIIHTIAQLDYERRLNMSKTAQSLVDGLGSTRLAAAIKEMMEQSKCVR